MKHHETVVSNALHPAFLSNHPQPQSPESGAPQRYPISRISLSESDEKWRLFWDQSDLSCLPICPNSWPSGQLGSKDPTMNIFWRISKCSTARILDKKHTKKIGKTRKINQFETKNMTEKHPPEMQNRKQFVYQNLLLPCTGYSSYGREVCVQIA